MGTKTLYVRDERGEFVSATDEAVVAAARLYLNRRIRRGASLNNPSAVRDFLATRLGDRDSEYFCALLLDSRHRFLRFVELFRGTLDAATVHPREVAKLALETPQTGAMIFAHNHPSQIGDPSAADELITRRLKEVLSLIGVRVIDHFIVAGGEVVSMSERGCL